MSRAIRVRGHGVPAVLCSLVALLAAPVSASAVAPPDLHVSAAGLIEETTGQQLYGLNANAELPIASTTKIMTALVTLQNVKSLNTTFTQNDWYPAAADSQIGLVPGERMTEHDLLLALMLPSADDAAEDLAHNVGDGSVAHFVAMMNADARALGLTHTHYSTPIGLDTPGNYSSAWDLDRLAAYVRQHSPLFTHIVALPRASLATGPVRAVVNRNDLVGRVPWINGVKTGHTAGAGYVLVASGTRDGMTLIGAVLGTASETARDANALALLSYGFAEFRMVQPVHAGQVVAVLPVSGQPSVHAAVIAGGGYERVLRRSDDVRVREALPRRLTGPLRRHAVVGELTVLLNGRPSARIPVLLARALAAAPATSLLGGISGRTLVFVLLLVVFLLLVLVAVRLQLRLRTPARDHLEAR